MSTYRDAPGQLALDRHVWKAQRRVAYRCGIVIVPADSRSQPLFKTVQHAQAADVRLYIPLPDSFARDTATHNTATGKDSAGCGDRSQYGITGNDHAADAAIMCMKARKYDTASDEHTHARLKLATMSCSNNLFHA